jgi:SAM-dependent methyltransferase
VSTKAADRWGGADYERLAATLAPIHDRVVDALRLREGERVLDVACGTGAVALRAVRAGADVTGLDISPDQLAKARAAAAEEGLDVRFDEGDAQALPYAAASFDTVSSAFGVIFADDHERAAAELARVCRTGGRLAVTAWREDGWSRLGLRLGYLQPGANPRLWAEEDHVRGLLGEAFDLRFEDGDWSVARDSPQELWQFMSATAPPLKNWLGSLDAKRRAEVDSAYLELLSPGELRREYLLTLGSRR